MSAGGGGGWNMSTSFFSPSPAEIGFAIEAEIRVIRRCYVCKGNNGACWRVFLPLTFLR